MTVKELIEKLKELPEDDPVFHWVYMGGDDELIEIDEAESIKADNYHREEGIVLK